MTDDASPENLRKFLESDDPALVRMGISLAKGAGVPDELLQTILKFYMWDDDKTIRAAAKSVFNKHAPAELKAKVTLTPRELWRSLNYLKHYNVELVKTGLMLADEAGVGSEAIKVLCEPLRESGDQIHNEYLQLVNVYSYDYSKRTSLVEALVEIGDLRVMKHLIRALDDDNDDVRGAVVWALNELKYEPDTDEIRSVFLAEKQEMMSFGVPDPQTG